jgi:hypothetical protein
MKTSLFPNLIQQIVMFGRMWPRNLKQQKIVLLLQLIGSRAVIEGQFLSMLLHSQNLGLKVSGRIICTGGASKNIQILQVISDVFGVPVYVGVRHFAFKCNRNEKFSVIKWCLCFSKLGSSK